MKVSKYTFLFETESKQFYIYNTLANSLIELDKESYDILINKQRHKQPIQKSDLDPDLYSILSIKRFITENDIDNFLLYKAIITKQRAESSHMHLTIAPTMDCCFNCHYCFEKNKQPDYMSEDIMNAIVSYLNNIETKPDIHLTWFGGEPLMALSQMETFYHKLTANYKKPNSSNIITTGFHLDDNAIKVLQSISVTHVQITLDGLKETHNKVKYIENKNIDAFDTVLNNIEHLLSSTQDIQVTFRVNLTKENANEYVTLYNQLQKKFNHSQRISISPAFVMQRGACNITGNQSSILYTPEEEAAFAINLWHKYRIYSPFLRYPSMFLNECAIRNSLAIAIDPQGYLYKCWEIIGNKDHAFGQLDNNGNVIEINEVILNRHLHGADPLEDKKCSVCNYLPICNGGCPIQRIENTFDNKNNNICTYYKGYLQEFLKIYLSLQTTAPHKIDSHA